MQLLCVETKFLNLMYIISTLKKCYANFAPRKQSLPRCEGQGQGKGFWDFK